MARLDPREGFNVLQDRVKEAVSSNFPREGKKHILELENVQINDDLDMNDIEAQKKAKMRGTTFGVPVKATMVLKDKVSGNVLEKKTLKIATLPKSTRRHSFIMKGSEYQVDSQWRLKPGIYTRVAQNGELQSRFNFQGKQSLDMIFDPKTKMFRMKHGGSKPPLYPILKAVGIDDDSLEKAWGKEILQANKTTAAGKAINSEKLAINFAKRLDPRTDIKDIDAASGVIRAYMEDSKLRKDVTKLTLGKGFDKITPDVLTRSSKRLLGVSRGDEKPDVRDALMFKDLLGIEDFIAERMGEGTKTIQRRIANNLDKKDTIRQIVGPDIFDRPIREFFSKSSLASTPEQTNPLQMLSGQQRTTITGEGGVKDAHKIMEDAKLVDPSHFGILDPLHTPESDKTGVTLHLSTSAVKKGKAVLLPLVNVKTGKTEFLDPKKVNDSIVAMPDEGRWDGEKWKPKAAIVKASIAGNEIREVKAKDVKYVMKNTGQMFSVATNMVPFLNSDSPNRSTMAGRHQEQAIPLKNPEAPLVQSDRGDGRSYDEFMGQYASHEATTSGTVSKIEPGAVHIKNASGKEQKIQIYDNYPLNDKKGMLHSNPVVKVGEKVKKGQLIADSNFTQNGVYAPGTNMRVGYTPWKGYNFEDGVVISETAAKRLTSEHLHKKSLLPTEAQVVGLKKFMANKSTALTKEQMGKLSEDGIIQQGMKVKKGDTLIAALAEKPPTTEAQMLKNLHRSLVNPFSNRSVTWDEDVEGEVVNVSKKGKAIQVHVKTSESMQVGDKLVGRHGNKGIVTRILSDNEMPQTEDGNPLEVVMNPIGIAGRMNVGQVLETAAGKLARKNGKPYKVQNFGQEDNRTKVEQDMKNAGISDKETIIDPVNNKKIPGVLVGDQYILKLQHQVDKKMMARSRDGYDRNLTPKGGGHHGAQALGSLGVYAMLAHGAKANIREMQTLKSDKAQNDEVWAALQAGEPIPPPQTTFAYKKFESYLKGMGVNVEKTGNSLNLMPLTDKQVEEMSNGELKDAGRAVRGYKIGSKQAGNIEPEKSGLFDQDITGGLDGMKWGHISLKEPIPNPVFEKAVKGVTNIRGPQFDRLIKGEEGVDKDGKIVKAGTKGASFGPQSIGVLLDKIDVQGDLKELESKIGGMKDGQKLNETRRKLKFLKALDKNNMTPREAYMMKKVPVLPPAMRPLSATANGSLQFDDLNQLYKDVALLDQQLREQPSYSPESIKAEPRADIYDRMKGLTGMGGSLKDRYKGIANIISGDSPKYGYVQDKLIKRKQDLTMRSTIVPEPALGLDDIGIPRKAATELYKPFVVREMRMAMGMGPLSAKKLIDEKPTDPAVKLALDKVVDERPLLVKRDPALHKYNIQAFKPKLTEGKAIKIHPLVCSGYNADFDGDTMSAYVPMTNEAVDEARKILPSRILFNPATARVMYTPSHEAQVGLYMKSEIGKKTRLKFKDEKELKAAIKSGKLASNDAATVGNVKTTMDRIEMDKILPKNLRGGKILTDLDYRFTKSEQNEMFDSMAKEDKNGYAKNIDKMKDLGNIKATYDGFSFGLEDFKTHKDIRDPILDAASEKAGKLNLDKDEDMDKFIDIYEGAMNDMRSKLKVRAKNGKNPIDKLEVSAGIKGKAYAQLTGAPGLFVDAKGEVVPSPVKRNYSEGLSASDYWASASGGRKGVIQKVQSVSEPGYLTKLMMNSTMNMLVSKEDCGTEKGISLDLDEPDIIGRYTTNSIKVGKTTIPDNTMLTPDVVSKMRNGKVSRVLVRSPMRCSHVKGICKKCAGLNENGQLHDLGTNVGVVSAQAIGERGTQLAMKAFHCLHPKSIVTVCPGRGQFPIMISMEDLFDLVDSELRIDEEGEFKLLTSEDGWLMLDGDGWTLLQTVRRHEPTRPMVMVSDQSAVTICQDNHPIAVRENLVRCDECGNHRLKKPSPSSSIKNGKHYCSKCGHGQLPPEKGVGGLGFLPPIEIEAKRWYGERRLLPPSIAVNKTKLNLDPYFVGAYLAEGWIGYRWTNSRARVKKPYSIGLKQKSGPIRDRILEHAHAEWNVRGKTPTIEVHSLELGCKFEELFGRYSRNVSLPPDFIHYEKGWLADCLCGLIDGDGTSKSDTLGADRIAIDTTSFELAQQIVIISTHLGIVSNLLATTHKELTRHQGFRVVLRITENAKEILSSSVKVAKVDKCSPDQEVLVSGQRLISNIRPVFYEGDTVYDVTTASSTFIAGGLLNHNSGGIFEGRTAQEKSVAAGGLDRAMTILHMPKKVKGSAKLAEVGGMVSSIDKDPAGGYNLKVGDSSHYIPSDRKLLTKVKKGMTIKKGDPLTNGPINPHELLPLTNMNKVQGYLASELHSIYAPEGIRRRNSEVVVRALSDVTKVEDPGDNGDFIVGDFAPTTVVNDWNKKNRKAGKIPVRHTPVLKGVKQIPLDVQTDWLARLNHENLRGTIVDAAQQGWASQLHGEHPIPPLIYGAEFGKGTKEKPWSY